MKILLTSFLINFLTLIASADSWAPETPQTISSPKGQFLLRAIPFQCLSDGKNQSKITFIIYRLDLSSQDYRETARFGIEGHPLELFINDSGDRIVTMDQYFGIGQGPRVVVVYNARGLELKKWALKDFYDKKKIGKLSESTASVHWRGSAGWVPDQKSIWISKPILTTKKDEDFDDYFLDVQCLKITKRVYAK